MINPVFEKVLSLCRCHGPSLIPGLAVPETHKRMKFEVYRWKAPNDPLPRSRRPQGPQRSGTIWLSLASSAESHASDRSFPHTSPQFVGKRQGDGLPLKWCCCHMSLEKPSLLRSLRLGSEDELKSVAFDVWMESMAMSYEMGGCVHWRGTKQKWADCHPWQPSSPVKRKGRLDYACLFLWMLFVRTETNATRPHFNGRRKKKESVPTLRIAMPQAV